jgi:hypothetical protein
MKTPIYTDITDLIVPNEASDPKEFSTTIQTNLPLFLNELGAKILTMAPRFYLRIKAPQTYNSLGMLHDNDRVYPIDKVATSSGNRYLIRLSLTPSIGWGINSCYIVEYWIWYPIVKGSSYVNKTIPRKKLIKTENWLVPSCNGYAALNYKEWFSYAHKSPKLGSIDISRGSGTYDAIPLDIIDIVSVVGSDGTIYQDFTVYKEVVDNLITQSINEEVYTELGIRFNGAAPLLNEVYTINYVKPPLFRDIIFLDQASSYNLYSQSYYPGVFDPRA